MRVVLQRLGLIRVAVFPNRDVAAVPLMILLAVLGACATGLLAQIRIFLPFTPVPLTGQVLGVLVCGSLLGAGYGALSQLIYIALGIMGLPWFTGGGAGMVWLSGATGGYLIGFAVAALFVGFCREHLPGARRLSSQIAAMIGGVVIIHAFGAAHLALALGMGFPTALSLGVAPFVFGDIMKAILGAMFVTAVLPSENASQERR